MEFSRQEHWSGLPFPSPGDIPDPGIEALQASLPSEPPGKPTPVCGDLELSKRQWGRKEPNCTAAKTASSVVKVFITLNRSRSPWSQPCCDAGGRNWGWHPSNRDWSQTPVQPGSREPGLSSRVCFFRGSCYIPWGLGSWSFSNIPSALKLGRFISDQSFLPMSHMYKPALTWKRGGSNDSFFFSFFCLFSPCSSAFLVGRQHDLIKDEWPGTDCGGSWTWCAASVCSPKTSASALLQIILHCVLEVFLTTSCAIVCRSLWS